eukprot:2534799-Alexandrium_andersonii.AAC.1
MGSSACALSAVAEDSVPPTPESSLKRAKTEPGQVVAALAEAAEAKGDAEGAEGGAVGTDMAAAE